MIALDTNLLIYAHRAETPQHSAAQAAIREAVNHPSGWGICVSSIAEFWSVVTNPKHPGEVSSSTDATSFIHHLIVEGHGNIWVPGPGFGERLMRWAASLHIHGGQIFDLQIAAIAY